MAPRLRSADQIAALLAGQIGELATTLLGDRNRRLSSGREWRWGRKGSLSVALAGGRAGCWFDHEIGMGGDALALIKRAQKCSFQEALSWASTWLHTAPAPPLATACTPSSPEADSRTRISTALGIWEETCPAAGTVVEAYLRLRGLELPPGTNHVLRCHRKLYHPAGESPGMVALLRDVVTDEPCGIHRTFLTAKGARHDKKMLGRSKGAAIKLCPDDEVTSGIGVAEGIETALSILNTGWRPVWALGSAGAIRRFPVLPGAQALTIFADHDEGGAGEAAAASCAERWANADVEVTIATPIVPGHDFNDSLRR